jgi:hypothetical protein
MGFTISLRPFMTDDIFIAQYGDVAVRFRPRDGSIGRFNDGRTVMFHRDVPTQWIGGEVYVQKSIILAEVGYSGKSFNGVYYTSSTHPFHPFVTTRREHLTDAEIDERIKTAPSSNSAAGLFHHPNRAMTDNEVRAWIASYYESGGVNRDEWSSIKQYNEIRRERGLSEIGFCPNMAMAARMYAQLAYQHRHGYCTSRMVPELHFHNDPYYGRPANRAAVFTASNNVLENVNFYRPGSNYVRSFERSAGHWRWVIHSELMFVGPGIVYAVDVSATGAFKFITSNLG